MRNFTTNVHVKLLDFRGGGGVLRSRVRYLLNSKFATYFHRLGRLTTQKNNNNKKKLQKTRHR